MSKKWFTDGNRQVLAEECPEGFRTGRLPVSEETRRKHSQNNGWKTMTEEQKEARSKKISETMNARSEGERVEYSEKISKARKGKGLGHVPWNKGVRGAQKAWNKGIKMSEGQKESLRRKYAELSEEEKERRKRIVSQAQKGKIPWNKGLSYTLDPRTVKEAKKKETESKKEAGSYRSSRLEAAVGEFLVKVFGEDNVKSQYFDEERYPFACDFYIEPWDAFVEVNGNWTHGGLPYDETDLMCQAKLAFWKEKAKESEYYKNAVYTWTDLDVRKAKAAIEHGLTYIRLYTEEDVLTFMQEVATLLSEDDA